MLQAPLRSGAGVKVEKKTWRRHTRFTHQFNLVNIALEWAANLCVLAHFIGEVVFYTVHLDAGNLYNAGTWRNRLISLDKVPSEELCGRANANADHDFTEGFSG